MKRFNLLAIFSVLVLLLTACPSAKDATKDTTDPTVKITSSNAATEKASYTLTGEAKDNVGVKKLEYALGSAARKTLPLTGGKFSQDITLKEGENTITVYAEDAAGNKADAQVKVTYKPKDTTDPTVKITSSNANTDKASYTLTGEATDNVGVTKLEYTLGNAARQVLTLTDGKFSQDITLAVGENTITVYAEDAAGNKADAQVKVIRTVATQAAEENAKAMAVAMNTAVESFVKGDYSEIEKLARKFVPAFVPLGGVTEQPVTPKPAVQAGGRQQVQQGCPQMSSVDNVMTLNFDVPSCQRTYEGVSYSATGKATLTRTESGGYTLQVLTPVKATLSKGAENFSLSISGSGSYSMTQTQNSMGYLVTTDVVVGMAADSKETGKYSYELSAESNSSVSVVMNSTEAAPSYSVTAGTAGAFKISDKINNEVTSFQIQTSTPFVMNNTCKLGPLAGSASVKFPTFTTTLAYTSCGKYTVTSAVTKALKALFNR